MVLPSGDHLGFPSSAGLWVRLIGLEPSAFMIRTVETYPPIELWNTIRMPSGVNIGRTLSHRSVVSIFLLRLPSAGMVAITLVPNFETVAKARRLPSGDQRGNAET